MVVYDCNDLTSRFVYGLTKGKHCLVHVVSFGDFDVPHRDEILYVADTKEELIELCREKKIKLDYPNGWAEYYIR